MVVNLYFKGEAGKRGLMFVSYYGRSRAFISNYSSWKEYQNHGKVVEVASSLLSHETLHLTLNKLSMSASAKLDNLFGRSNNWDQYPHGLGDLDRAAISYVNSYKNGSKSVKKGKRRKA